MRAVQEWPSFLCLTSPNVYTHVAIVLKQVRLQAGGDCGDSSDQAEPGRGQGHGAGPKAHLPHFQTQRRTPGACICMQGGMRV